MSGPRIYGSVVFDGLRHEASGVVDGTFAKTKGGWDTYTICGKYCTVAVEPDGDLVISCIRCLGRKRNVDYKGILRGVRYDETVINEAPTFIDTSHVYTPADQMNIINAVGQTIRAGASRTFVAGTPSTHPPISVEVLPASRRSRSRG